MSKVVDLGPHRLRKKARDLYVVCPRCQESTFMRHTRCEVCGLWFDGEAFQFHPSDQASRPAARYLWWPAAGLLALLLLAALALLWNVIF